LSALKSIRSGISYDAAGVPSWTLELGEIKNPSVTLDEIFSYIESAEKPCIVAIDEFQQINKYDDKNVEALLRTYVQNCTNANFIFSGSHRTMMAEMFTSPSRPFYQSVTLMSLSAISSEVYYDFCHRVFVKAGKNLDRDVVSELYDMFEGVTFYLQRMMNEMFAMTAVGECCDVVSVKRALNKILDNSSYIYEDLLYQLPEKQSVVLRAIARENKAAKIMSAEFVGKYSLGSASSVMSAVNGLLEKGIVTKDRGEYFVYDYFLKFWLNER
jgi:AAA+ ATPase superfamily predicted ATPase